MCTYVNFTFKIVIPIIHIIFIHIMSISFLKITYFAFYLFLILMFRNSLASWKKHNSKEPYYMFDTDPPGPKGGRGLPTVLIECFILFGLFLHLLRIYILEIPDWVSPWVVVSFLIICIVFMMWSEGVMFSKKPPPT